MNEHRPGRADAVISIYLALALLLVLGLICTVTESARVRIMDSRAAGIAWMAADSAFAAFARPVFDDYGVMMLWESPEELKTDLDDFLKGNTENSAAGSLVFTDLYGLRLSESSVPEVTHPTDDAGSPFAQQVAEYMEYTIAQDAIERLLSGNSIFSQGEKVSEFMDKIQEHEDTFTDVEESVEDIKEKIDKAQKKGRDPLRYLDEMYDALKGFADTEDSGHIRDFKDARGNLKKTQKQLLGYMEDIEKKTEKYYGYVEKAKAAVNELEGDLEADAASYEPEIYSLIREQMDDLKEKSADTDEDFYDVGANSSIVRDITDRLKALDYLFEETEGTPDEENTGEYLNSVEYYRNMFADFSLDDLGVNYQVSAVEKEDKGFLKAASKILKNGLLGFIAGEVSEKTVKTDSFPSGKMTAAQKKEKSKDLATAAKDKLLFGEYILTHFAHATRELEETALEYEAEYILAGKKKDKDNLAAAVADIVALRTGCNLISLLKSSSKKAETYTLATSLVGFTGMPVVIKVMQLLLMAAWSLAESIADTKAMLEGGKVETIKDGDDWYISLWALKNFGKEKLVPAKGQKGLGYEDYLRLLLLMQPETAQCFRTMDMIQADICLRENKAFRVSECITAAKINTGFEAPQLFVAFPFAAKVSGAAYGTYGFDEALEYSY